MHMHTKLIMKLIKHICMTLQHLRFASQLQIAG